MMDVIIKLGKVLCTYMLRILLKLRTPLGTLSMDLLCGREMKLIEKNNFCGGFMK